MQLRSDASRHAPATARRARRGLGSRLRAARSSCKRVAFRPERRAVRQPARQSRLCVALTTSSAVVASYRVTSAKMPNEILGERVDDLVDTVGIHRRLSQHRDLIEIRELPHRLFIPTVLIRTEGPVSGSTRVVALPRYNKPWLRSSVNTRACNEARGALLNSLARAHWRRRRLGVSVKRLGFARGSMARSCEHGRQ
jgi:hypothetical protein